jgi:hypothetical protein
MLFPVSEQSVVKAVIAFRAELPTGRDPSHS